MAQQQPPPMATPRVAAGALFFDDQDRVLVVRPTYKPHWDIPGGYVEPGESPAAACRREVREELGIEPPLGRLLVVDWAPNDSEGDKLLFLFDGLTLSQEQRDAITLPAGELRDWRFLPQAELASTMIPRLARRMTEAMEVRQQQSSAAYLEHGVPAAAPASVP